MSELTTELIRNFFEIKRAIPAFRLNYNFPGVVQLAANDSQQANTIPGVKFIKY